jgi:hypothetical protein
MRTLSVIPLLLSTVMPAQMEGQTLSFFRPTPGFGPTAVAVNASGIYVAASSVAKYDSEGNELWRQGINGVPLINGAPFAVAADATGVYIVGGPLLRKYNGAGNELWTRSF